MGNIEHICNYFNPFNEGFKEASNDFNYKLHLWQKIAVIGAAVFAGIIGLGISSIAAFRFTVEKLSLTNNPSVLQTHSLSRKRFKDTIEPVEQVKHQADAKRVPLPNIKLSQQTLTSLLSGAAYIAPRKEAAYEYEILTEGAFTTYVTWYDEQSETVNIQLKEEFDCGSRKELTILSQADQNRRCKKAEIVRSIAAELEREQACAKMELNKMFAKNLPIVQKFFNGEKGNQHTQHHPVVINEIRMWPGRSRSGRFLLHLKREAQDPNLTLSLNNKGIIEWIYLNSQKVCPRDLLENETWGPLLEKHLDNFLQQHALQHTSGPILYSDGVHDVIFMSELQVHPAAIEKFPEHMLTLLGPRQLCRYLNDDLTVSPGIDGGGLSRQLYHDLALHLFDGSPNRKISVTQSAVPIMHDPDSKEEQDLLRRVGNNLIKNAMLHEEVTLGNVLHPGVYACIKLLVLFNNTIVDESMMQAAKLLCHNDEYAFLFEVYENPREFSANEIQTLTETLCLVEKSEIPISLSEIKELAKVIILDDCRYRQQVLAIHYMVDGMFGVLPMERFLFRQIFDAVMEQIPDEKLCEFVQGVKFDPQGIADRIFTESEDSVVLQKCAWMKQYILESSEEEIERFLIAVTGSSTVTASTKIEISGAEIPHCTASTCTKTINVPFIHTDLGTSAGQIANDKQKFLNNFKLIYSVKGFDMG